MGTLFSVSDLIMPFHTNGLQGNELDKMFEILLNGLTNNARLDEKRKLVNSILPRDKCTLLQRFLSYEEGLTRRLRLNCLHIFLDERTKFFSFVQFSDDKSVVESVLRTIPRYCPNIETIDFTSLRITTPNKKLFLTVLKKSTQLKSLRVHCWGFNCKCVIYQLLLVDEFHLHDREVQNGLLKIDYIDGYLLKPSACAKLLTLLPNLKSLGLRQELSSILPVYSNNEVIVNKLSNITEFGDNHTTLNSLECFSKVCQKVKKIALWYPQNYVLENLWKFPLLTELKLKCRGPDFVNELINLLTRIGRQIKILILNFSDWIVLDPNILHDLCPELVKLEINDKLF